MTGSADPYAWIVEEGRKPIANQTAVLSHLQVSGRLFEDGR